MLTITRRFTFEAAHCLPGHLGKCQHIHGHSYRLDVTIARKDRSVLGISDSSSCGMVCDFSDMKKLVTTNILEMLDHQMLNEVYDFRPTAENMVCDIFRILTTAFGKVDIEVIGVRLWETEDSYAEVTK